MSATFDPQKYWETRWAQNTSLDAPSLLKFFADTRNGPPYATLQHKVRAGHLEWLEGAIKNNQWTTILDAGCGPGFWFPLWQQLGLTAQACDRTDLGVQEATSMAAAIGSDIPVQRAELSSLPYADKSFDVVVTVMVLLHTPPDQMRATLKELARVANNILLLEQIYPTDAKLPPHVFDHDYRGLAVELGLTIVSEQPRDRDLGAEWLFHMVPNA